MRRLKKLITDLFLALGYSIRPTLELNRSEKLARSGALLELLASSPTTRDMRLQESLEIIRNSKSQLGQDILALSQTGTKQTGYFVEFGATNGLSLSNTYLLEKMYGWKGIVCEPAKKWHEELSQNRSCLIDTRCVYASTGQRIPFSETAIGELSTISAYLKSDAHRVHRKNRTSYEVETVTLKDLLQQHGAPSYIDFLSIDTEGSEYEILRRFDFSSYSFGLICVEHNFTSSREKIHELLFAQGYSRVFVELSGWDDWYVAPRK
jgi:FkbM family methyltransferase